MVALRVLVFGPAPAAVRVSESLRSLEPAVAVTWMPDLADVGPAFSRGPWAAAVLWAPDGGGHLLAGLSALVEAAGNDVPVIVVLPSADGGRAEALMRAGVRDCVTDDQLLRLAPVIDRELGVATDRRERRALEAQLRHAQRMEAVGQLASGIAHDFNNLLMAVTGYTELLLDRLEPQDPLREVAEGIRGATVRASGLTRQLLSFSRRREPSRGVLDLNLLLTEMQRMLQRVIGEHIELVVTLAPGESCVTADRGQIEQVIMNLVVNARDAMPGGGHLRLTTSHVAVGAGRRGAPASAAPGSYVALEVQDTGQGMDEQTRARLFEPFFTTKDSNTGTGLGLSTVQAIVQASGGFVTVRSQIGEGATFRILLPRASDPVTAAPARRRRPSLPRGTETVLLVEDETGVRELVRDLLARWGYRVLDAGDVTDATALFEAHRDEIRLLVTDVVMPQVNGRQLAERFRSRRPDLKVLYMSGYTDDQVLAEGDEAPAAFLQKPFTPDVLARKVREVLDGTRSGT